MIKRVVGQTPLDNIHPAKVTMVSFVKFENHLLLHAALMLGKWASFFCWLWKGADPGLPLVFVLLLWLKYSVLVF